MSLPKIRCRRRRGISTVVTSVLLVSAVSIMGAFLVAWSNSSFAVQRLNVASATAERINLINESFVVEDAWFFQNNTGKFTNLAVRNTGDNAIKISSIYINNTEVTFTDETIRTGEMAVIDFPLSWGSDRPQSVWVKTDRGTEVKQVWKS
jgi:hypothetical protein